MNLSNVVKKIRSSIIGQLLLVIATITVLSFLIVATLALLEQQRQLDRELNAKATSLVQFMAHASPISVMSLNFVQMNDNVKEAVLTDAEAVYAIIKNEQNVPLVYYFREGDPLFSIEARDLLQGKDPIVVSNKLKETGRILEVSARILSGGNQIGTATLGFSKDKMHQSLVNQLLIIGIVMTVITSISVLLLLFLLTRFLNPIQTLTNAASQISSGNLDVSPVGTERIDEIGVLSRTFGSMIQQIRDTLTTLKRLSKFNEAILSAIPTPVFYKNKEGVYLGCNLAFTELMGMNSEQIKGKRAYEIWSDSEAKINEEKDQELLENPTRQVFEYAIRDKDGTNRPVIYARDVFYDENDRVAGIVGAFIDITDRKKAEEALHLVAEEVEDLYNNAPCGYHSLDKDGVFVRINETELKWIGYTREDVLGKLRFTDIVTPDSVNKFRENFPRFKTSGFLRDLEFEMIRKDGSILPVLVSATAIYDKDGNYLMSRSTIFDITERKKLDKMKDDFLSITTHELKTPLVPIKSQSQLLLGGDYGDLNPKQHEAIEMIFRNEEILNSLSSEVLDISKIKSNKFKILPEDAYIDKVINEAVDDIKASVQENNINLSLIIPPNLPMARFDPQRIKQVIANLLDNAIKFTPEHGQISVEVRQDNNEIVVSVKDTGIGLSQDNITKLFTPFFQVDSDMTRKNHGTGLGLAICKGIMEAHKGNIWAESEGLGKGSTFVFNLPLRRS